MRRISLAFAICSLLSLGGAQAQLAGGMMFPGPGTPASSGGGAYVGPGDSGIQPGAAAWIGLRAYSLAKAGTKAINLCDNAGANCSDESTNASGNLVVGTLGMGVFWYQADGKCRQITTQQGLSSPYVLSLCLDRPKGSRYGLFRPSRCTEPLQHHGF